MANDAGAGITHVPLIWSVEDTCNADFTLDLILSNTGVPLSLYEQGLTYNRSAAEGLSNCEMARRTGVSEGHVRNARELATVPDCLSSALADGVIAETLALEVWRTFGEQVSDRLRSALELAQRQNRPKLVRSMFWPPAPTQRVAVRAVAALEHFRQALSGNDLKFIKEAINGASQHSDMIAVPAHLLRGLVSRGVPGGKTSPSAPKLPKQEARNPIQVRETIPVLGTARGQREGSEAVCKVQGPTPKLYSLAQGQSVGDEDDMVRDRTDVEPIPDYEINQDCYAW